MTEFALQALFSVLTPVNVLASLGGVLFGLFIGATPGLTISLGMVLLLPVTYSMDPITSISLLLGLFISGMTGGSISAILLNIPGTPSASATAIAGHQMARRGQAAAALGTAVTSSFFGALVSLIVLVLAAPAVARAALKFGEAELAALLFLGLTLICSFGQKSMVKGLISGAVGLIITTIGLDPIMARPRFTFGMVELQSGINFLPVMIGLFAIPQILNGLVMKSEVIPRYEGKIEKVFSHIKGLFHHFRYKIVSALIGTGVGAIPGAGGPIAVFLAYDVARRMTPESKRDDYDNGNEVGVAAPEAANNGINGGALIPMLTLGIPGDPITAILLGSLMIQGLTPGPLLFRNNPLFVYGVFWAFLVGAIFVLFVTLLTMRVWVAVLRVPRWILLPIISIFCVVGTFSLRNSFWDTGVMLVFGLLGFLMIRYQFPVVPMLLAIVLGPAFEQHVRVALITSKGNPSIFVTKPISLVFVLIALFSFFSPIVRSLIKKRESK
jgi:putative tricarboxylic transport membrane protein